jgi:Leucine-rich repeat (LRR) protein
MMDGVVVIGVCKYKHTARITITHPKYVELHFKIDMNTQQTRWDLKELKRTGEVTGLEFWRMCPDILIQLGRSVVAALPDDVDCIPTLKSLAVCDMGFPQIIPSLTRFYVRDNATLVIPPSICQLVHLQRLDLMNNNLTKLPVVVGTLPALRFLVLTSNKFTKFPKCMIGHPTLEDVNVHDTNIAALPGALRLFPAIHVWPAGIPMRPL